MTPLSLHCDMQSGLQAKSGCDRTTVGSVWFRRPRLPEEFPNALEADVPFLRTEWRRFCSNLDSLAAEATDALWVNPPAAALSAENKLVQLHAARQAGLTFPATLMSSDPVQIRRFANAHGRVVYKPFQTHTWQDGASGRMYSSYARVVDEEMLRDDASLRQCPGIYQQLVDKQYDLRVTIIGHHAFTVRLDSPSRGDFIDWRVSSLADNVQATPADLPDTWVDGLHRLMRKLGIVFGCIDLAVDREGGLHFLEVNQAGQFLFLEHAVPSMPLLRATCALLTQARPDYTLESAPAMTYAEYVDSDQHRQWWETASAGLEHRDGAIPGVSVE